MKKLMLAAMMLPLAVFAASELKMAPVPKAVTKSDAKVFFAVKALGGNMHGWRKDPVNNPPRVRLDFFEWKNGVFTCINGRP